MLLITIYTSQVNDFFFFFAFPKMVRCRSLGSHLNYLGPVSSLSPSWMPLRVYYQGQLSDWWLDGQNIFCSREWKATFFVYWSDRQQFLSTQRMLCFSNKSFKRVSKWKMNSYVSKSNKEDILLIAVQFKERNA